MMNALAGPLVVQPESWTLVFSRETTSWWASLIALGRYKHVRAYAYVPFLHVWVFYDVHLTGTDIIVAADGPPAHAMIASWIEKADLIRIRRGAAPCRLPPAFGFCVPAIKRLIGLNCSALRPDALWRHCLRNGGQPFEAKSESADLPAAAT